MERCGDCLPGVGRAGAGEGLNVENKEWTKEEVEDLVRRANSAGFPNSVFPHLTKGGESALVALFMSMAAGDAGRSIFLADGIADFCHVELEYPFARGRADVVIFHEDGSATIIEAKDGINGIRHVISGMGQLASYAYQLGASKGAPKAIRRALMWSSVGDNEGDAHIEEVCRINGVIPIMMASMKRAREATCKWLEVELCKA